MPSLKVRRSAPRRTPSRVRSAAALDARILAAVYQLLAGGQGATASQIAAAIQIPVATVRLRRRKLASRDLWPDAAPDADEPSADELRRIEARRLRVLAARRGPVYTEHDPPQEPRLPRVYRLSMPLPQSGE